MITAQYHHIIQYYHYYHILYMGASGIWCDHYVLLQLILHTLLIKVMGRKQNIQEINLADARMLRYMCVVEWKDKL